MPESEGNTFSQVELFLRMAAYGSTLRLSSDLEANSNSGLLRLVEASSSS